MKPLWKMLFTLLVGLGAFGSADAAQFKVVYAFKGGSDGAWPNGVILDHGVLYGTTSRGGNTDCYKHKGCGTAFKITPDGTKTTLALFGPERMDGKNPFAPLTLARDGNFFGTTDAGGKHNRGSIFELTPSGTVTIVHSFNWNSDGAYPQHAALLADRKGNLYGVDPNGPNGAVYKIDADGSETVLHQFSGGADGAAPYGTPLRDPKSGDLYGTTLLGGYICGNTPYGSCGLLFKIAGNGSYSVLHFFDYSGLGPYGGLVADDDGNLYGTTLYGGGSNSCPYSSGCGSVFKLAPDGTFSILYTFTGGAESYPGSGLIRDSNGNLYGTTIGYDFTAGSVFEVSPQGVETTLHVFTYTDGANPSSDLVFDNRGHIYGATSNGGYMKGVCSRGGCGVIFEITP